MDPWDVLTDRRIETATRNVFGTVSLNPFYSNPATTLSRRTLFVVGQNPGGDPRTHESQLRDLPLGHPTRPAEREDWCKFLDENWETSYREGTKYIAARALPGGVDGLRKAFCSNALFMRGDMKAASSGDVTELWSVCAPWHERWLKVARPRVVLCLGNGNKASAYHLFQSFLTSTREAAPLAIYSNYALKLCDGLLAGEPITLVGTPNTSQWMPSAAASTAAVARIAEVVGRLVL